MAARSICRPIWRRGQNPAAIPAGAERAAAQAKKNCELDGTAAGLGDCPDAPGGVPPSPPTPHPSGERPWAALAPGSSFLAKLPAQAKTTGVSWPNFVCGTLGSTLFFARSSRFTYLGFTGFVGRSPQGP